MVSHFKSPHVDDRRDFAALLDRAGKAMVKHLTERPARPVDCSVPPEQVRRKLLTLALPANGMTANEILSFLEDNVMPWSMPTNHPL